MKCKFSDRIGMTKPSSIQLDFMNLSLRNSLWNLMLRTVFYGAFAYYSGRVKFIADFFLKVPRDEVPDHGLSSQLWLKNIFYDKEFKWWHIYNLLEFLANNLNKTMDKSRSDWFILEANRILEEEAAGYRFINGELSPITNPNEIGSIVDAIEISHANNLFGAETHLNTALDLLSKKPEPDYRNSIKESISAIESVAEQITGERSDGLKKAMNALDAKVKFHGGLKSAILSLYGYTSDEDGIRHAIIEEKDLGFDEAKFMLVTCSALVNFIIAKACKHGSLPPI